MVPDSGNVSFSVSTDVRIIAPAVVTAALSVALTKRLGLQMIASNSIVIPPKTLGKGSRCAVGGFLFGIEGALTAACPDPLFALVGNGITVMIVAILSALAGTWLYGWLRPRLPH